MEAELKELVEAGLPENKNRWALRWKEEKGKVFGVVGPNIPEEVLYAAGILPWGASGTWEAATPLASAYRPSMTSVFCTHLLESVLNGDMDFLNGMVTAQYDDDFKHLWSVQDYLNKPSFSHIMYLPHVNRKPTLQAWADSIRDLKKAIEEQANLFITDEALNQAIDIYNTTRRLLRSVYDLRKKEEPALSGAEVLGLTTAARIMPKDAFNGKLEALLPYLENRKASLKHKRPRLLVTSDFLYHPGYIKLIEDAGCVVAMDDLDTGSRYFWHSVDAASDDPLRALARRYLDVSSPRMADWDEQIDQIVSWVDEFNIDGIIELRQLYAFPREFQFTYSIQKLKEADIPHMDFRVEYHLAGVGMLTTRIEALLEVLRGKLGEPS